jgi:hypothetical protein
MFFVISLQKFFAKIFYSECGSGSRSQLNVCPDPKHLKKISFLAEGFENTKIFAKTWAQTKIFTKILQKPKLFVKTIPGTKFFTQM